MATTASDIQAQAMIDSWLKSQSVKDMQTSIDDAYKAGVSQAEASNQQILNQLNQNKIDYQNQYDKGARGAYVNKMQNIQQVDNELARLGLTDSGFGVSQKLFADSLYSQNMQGLQDALQTGLRDVDNKVVNQNLKLQEILAGLDRDKAGDMLNYNKYITDKTEQIRNNERDNYFREQELLRQQQLDAFKQQMAEKEYQLALKEANDRAYYNSQRLSSGGSGRSGGGSTGGYDINNGVSIDSNPTIENKQPSKSIKPKLTPKEYNKLQSQLSVMAVRDKSAVKVILQNKLQNGELSETEVRSLYKTLHL